MENLDTYLKRTGVSRREFAVSVGLNASTVSRFIRHLASPSLATAFKIERATGGAVPVSSWQRAESGSEQVMQCISDNQSENVLPDSFPVLDNHTIADVIVSQVETFHTPGGAE